MRFALPKWTIIAVSLFFPVAASAVDILVSSLLDAPDPAVREGEITYAVEVQNQQSDTASNVVLSFPLPGPSINPTSVFVSVDNGACSHDGGTPGTVTCNYGDMLGTAAVPAGPIETANIVIRSTQDTGNTLDVTASVTTDSSEANTVNNTLTQNTTIDDGADLTTTLVGTPNPVLGGGDLDYTATVSNNGPNNASSVQVVFILSPNLSYESGSASGSGWSCSISGQQLTCTRGSLADSSSAPDITFTAQVTGATGGTLTSTATVSAATGDPVPNNNVVTSDVTLNEGTDVAVTISSSSGSVIAGNNITLTLAPRNLGPFDAEDVDVVYTIPAGFTLVGSPNGTGWSCGVVLPIVTCSRSSYVIGATDDISLTLTAPFPAAPTVYSNPVSISTTTAEAAERMANNTDSVNVTVNPDGVDLSISKTKGPQPVAQGSSISSVITVHNNGPRNALAGTVTIQDVLVVSETYVSFSGTNWSCTDNTPNIDCTYNAALNNDANSSTLTITTTAAASGSLSNTATVAYSGSPGDYNNANDSDSETVTSTSLIGDLQLSKSADADNSDGDITTLDADPAGPNLEPTITYTLTIFNDGPDAVDGIVLRDPIPGYISGQTTVAVTASPANYSCSTGSTVVCTQTSGSLADQASDSFTITVTRPIRGGTRTNNATAFSTTVGDDDRSNNSASTTVVVETVADVEVQSKSVSPNPVKSGVEATYVITVRNNGPDTAQNVSVVDTFSLAGGDTGFTFISVSESQGSCSGLTPGNTYVAADTPTLTCNLGNVNNNNTATITLKIRPNYMASPPTPRTMDNSVTISTTTYDDNSLNDDFGPVTLTIVQDDIDLLINNSDIPDPVAWDPASSGDNANNDVVYHVEYTNRGPSYATGVQYVYTMTPKAGKTVRFDCDEAAALDACGVSTDTCSITGGSNPVTGGDTLELTCTGNTVSGKTDEMTANSTGHRYLHFRVLTEPDGTGDTHNTNAVISANEAETILGNNAEAETTSVRGRVDLEVTKTPSDASVELDQPYTWTISVVNNGPVESDQTDLTDTLPAGMIFHGAVPSWNNANDSTSGNCSIAGSDLSCDLGTMSVGATAIISVPVMMDAFTASSVQNCATATTTGVDVTPANNEDICGAVTVINNYFPSDYGDAPDTTAGTGAGDYATTLDNGGPRHIQPGGTWLGACVDSDGDGSQQNLAANDDDVNAGVLQAGTCSADDDEDGINLPPALVAGQDADLEITIAGSDCALDGWVDYNADGDFNDAGEQIFNALSLAAGNHTETITVPGDLTIGDSYSRFRCSAAGGLSPVEETTGGEVEDYLISLQPDPSANLTPVDYGDAPDTSPGTGAGNYQTLPSDDGASHVLGVASAPYLGACVDSDNNTQQNSHANADDLGAAAGVTPAVTVGACSTTNDDEDGVTFSILTQDLVANIDVTASSGTNACLLNAWIDFNRDGIFSGAGEQIAADVNIASGATTSLTPTIPAAAIPGSVYARFRCSSAGGDGPVGAANDGEVEDYLVEIRPNLSLVPVDFGDAPDTYLTTEASNGPSHLINIPNAPYLGSCVDSDTGTNEGVTADADDLAAPGGLGTTVGSCSTANLDEDGVVFLDTFNRGSSSRIEITTGADGDCTLNGWIDFDLDGSFGGAGEQVVTDIFQVAASTETYLVEIPSSAIEGETYVRIRCSSVGGLSFNGPAADGEVEDYTRTIRSILTVPSVSQYGLVMLAAMLLLIGIRKRAINHRSG